MTRSSPQLHLAPTTTTAPMSGVCVCVYITFARKFHLAFPATLALFAVITRKRNRRLDTLQLPARTRSHRGAFTPGLELNVAKFTPVGFVSMHAHGGGTHTNMYPRLDPHAPLRRAAPLPPTVTDKPAAKSAYSTAALPLA